MTEKKREKVNYEGMTETAVANEIKWATPPTTGSGAPVSTKWASIAETLMLNPKQWAVVAENVSASTAHLIRTGGYKAFQPAGSFEATTRGNSGGRAAEVYARYVGVKD
jgi:hypothetical protein